MRKESGDYEIRIPERSRRNKSNVPNWQLANTSFAPSSDTSTSHSSAFEPYIFSSTLVVRCMRYTAHHLLDVLVGGLACIIAYYHGTRAIGDAISRFGW